MTRGRRLACSSSAAASRDDSCNGRMWRSSALCPHTVCQVGSSCWTRRDAARAAPPLNEALLSTHTTMPAPASSPAMPGSDRRHQTSA
jgi:hypothetical protein